MDGFTEDEIAQLGRFPADGVLEELDLSNTSLFDEDLAALARLRVLRRLRVLAVGDNLFGPEGVRHLAASPHLERLRELDLTASGPEGIGPEAVTALASGTSLRELSALSLHAQNVGGEGLELLAGWEGLRGIVRLDIGLNFGRSLAEWLRDPAGLMRLIESPHWQAMRELNIRSTIHGLEALEAFVAAKNVASLRVLRLGEFYDDAAGVQQDDAAKVVAKAPNLEGLTELHFEKAGLTAKGQRALEQRFGERLVLVG
jgi:hypothetical protein